MSFLGGLIGGLTGAPTGGSAGGTGGSGGNGAHVGNESTSSNDNRTISTNYNLADYGGAGSASQFIVGNTAPVTTSDYGAIQMGVGLASDTIHSALDALTTQSASVINKTLGIASQNQTSQDSQVQGTLIKLGLIIGAVVAAIVVFKK